MKLDFNLLSKASLGEKIYYNKTNIPNIPKMINLGGSLIMKIIDSCSKNIISKVYCSENTKLKEIRDRIPAIKILNGDTGYIADFSMTIGEYLFNHGNNIIQLDCNCLYGAGCNEYYIDDDLLDPSYDYDFTKIYDGDKKFYRGGLEYKRPCGWKRYALKVNGKYSNDSWLGNTGESKGDSEWAVAYHGTKIEFLDSIMRNGLRPGPRHAYGYGIYCTPNIERAAKYARIFSGDDGKFYQVVVQNRVKPSAIKLASLEGGPDDYWIIEKSEDIRLYSICLRECPNC